MEMSAALVDTSSITNASSSAVGNNENGLSSNQNSAQSESVITANYELNKFKALAKIRQACDKENYCIEYNDFATSVNFNTAAYGLFKKYISRYYVNHPTYVLDTSKPNILKDKKGNVTQGLR